MKWTVKICMPLYPTQSSWQSLRLRTVCVWQGRSEKFSSAWEFQKRSLVTGRCSSSRCLVKSTPLFVFWQCLFELLEAVLKRCVHPFSAFYELFLGCSESLLAVPQFSNSLFASYCTSTLYASPKVPGQSPRPHHQAASQWGWYTFMPLQAAVCKMSSLKDLWSYRFIEHSKCLKGTLGGCI